MSLPLRLGEIPPETLWRDVYFREDFLQLHAPRGLEIMARPAYQHAAAQVPIPGSDRYDLETPWGYGGPVASNPEALAAGLAEWRSLQRQKGRVAEFIRLHPFVDPVALEDHLDMLEFNRLTVIVDLKESEAARWNFFSDSTRNCIRKARRILTMRPLIAAEWPLFKELYEAGLQRNEAVEAYFLRDGYYRALLASAWCRAWVAEDKEGPVAVSCFLHSGTPFAHYHLAGGNSRSRSSNALYLLLEHAFVHYTKLGCRWFHLGGGRSTFPDDSLLAFKSKFSPQRAPFYTGGLIFDVTAYRALGGGRGRFLCVGVGTEEEPVSTRS